MSETAKVITKSPKAKKENRASQSPKPALSQSINSSLDQIMYSHQTIGNRAVAALFRSGFFQAKLRIDQPNNVYEQEADRVAEQVMRMPDTAISSQRSAISKGNEAIRMKPGRPFSKGPSCGEEEIMEKPLAVTPLCQHKAADAEVASDTESAISAIRGGGQPLPNSARNFFEPRFGYDFSRVRVHTGATAAESAQAVNALAYTLRRDVFFAAGQYKPDTMAGNRLLAHELAHVIQQRTLEGKGSSCVSASHCLQRTVGSVSCQNPSGRVRDIVGNNPFGTVQAADTRAIELLGNAIRELVHAQEQIRSGKPPAWPVMSDALGVALRERFGMNPEDREMWVSRQRLTPLGVPTISLLVFRLERTREVLADGRIRYRCLDRPPCPPMSESGEVVLGPLAWSDPEEGRIYLCEGFWRDLTKDGRALLLVHEAFHVYFGGIDRGRNMWNAHCIENFIADTNGVTIPEDSEGCCAPGAVCEY